MNKESKTTWSSATPLEIFIYEQSFPPSAENEWEMVWNKRNLKLPRLQIRPFSENCYLLLLSATGGQQQIHHTLLNPHIWRQFGVSSKTNGSATMAGNWIIQSPVRKEHVQFYTNRPGDHNLKQNLIAMRQWWSVLRRSLCHMRYLGLCLQMCLQIPETTSVSSSSRGQMSQGRETLETQTCSVTQLSPQSKTKEFTSLLRFFYLGTIN